MFLLDTCKWTSFILFSNEVWKSILSIKMKLFRMNRHACCADVRTCNPYRFAWSCMNVYARATHVISKHFECGSYFKIICVLQPLLKRYWHNKSCLFQIFSSSKVLALGGHHHHRTITTPQPTTPASTLRPTPESFEYAYTFFYYDSPSVSIHIIFAKNDSYSITIIGKYSRINSCFCLYSFL